MRIVVTRPEPAGERTAAALRARGHDVLVAPLMRIEPVAADLTGRWQGVIVTSANAPSAAAAKNPSLLGLPTLAVGERSARAARDAGFTNVMSADGDARKLMKLIASSGTRGPLLYLAGEDRATDLGGELATHGIEVATRVVYRAVTAAFPPELIAAVESGDIEAAMHFSARSAANYVSGAKAAGLLPQALDLRQLCLSAQVAAPLAAAGAKSIAISPRPDEAALIELAGRA